MRKRGREEEEGLENVWSCPWFVRGEPSASLKQAGCKEAGIKQGPRSSKLSSRQAEPLRRRWRHRRWRHRRRRGSRCGGGVDKLREWETTES